MVECEWDTFEVETQLVISLDCKSNCDFFFSLKKKYSWPGQKKSQYYNCAIALRPQLTVWTEPSPVTSDDSLQGNNMANRMIYGGF